MAGLAPIARSQVITEFSPLTPNSFPVAIVAGPDGALWFTEEAANQIGRMTTSGAVTEFFVPTPLCSPMGIAVGPDGNIWFTEHVGNKIGRLTMNGVFTEFPIPTGVSSPNNITAGADGNLWFTEGSPGKIGRITTAGVITEFPVPTFNCFPLYITAGPDGNVWFTENAASEVGRITPDGAITIFPLLVMTTWTQGITVGPDGNLWFATNGGSSGLERITTAGTITGMFPIPDSGNGADSIVAGPDGNLWFTQYTANRIGRMTTDGGISEFPLPAPNSGVLGIAIGSDGNVWFTEGLSGLIGRLTTPFATPLKTETDFRPAAGGNSNANGVLEPGESVEIAPVWKNNGTAPQAFTGTAVDFSGPPGPTYTIEKATADYGTAAAGATVDCHSATGDCYRVSVSGARPAQHWDATFTENLSYSGMFNAWTIHIGNSFSDVLEDNQFYFFVESLYHSGVTGGCGPGLYCPDTNVSRAQAAVLLLKAKFGWMHYSPPATGQVFGDVRVGDFAADSIEELARLQITGGCGAGNYCPGAPVARKQMAVFLLRTAHGATYQPPPCQSLFADVACPGTFAAWIEEASSEGFTAGCGGNNYCPDAPTSRGQTAVFLDRLMGLPGPPSPTLPPTATPTATATAMPTATLTPTPTPSPILTPTPTTTGGMCGPFAPYCPTSTRSPTPTSTPTP